MADLPPELAERFRVLVVVLGKIEETAPALPKARRHEQINKGAVMCPRCEGVLHWRRDPSNNHRMGACDTPMCFSFIE